MREEAVRGAELCADAELRSVWDPRSGLGGGGGEGTGTNVAASAVPQSEGTALAEGCSEHFILAGWSPCFLFSFFRGGRGERW